VAARRGWSRSAPPPPPDPASIRPAALRLLGRRDYTKLELARKLTVRGYAEADVEALLARLSSEGLLDDRRTAAAHVRTSSRVKGRGPVRIRLELKARGLAAEDVTEATAGLTDADVREALERLLARKHVTLPVPADARPRLFQQLLRRGFPAHLISAVLRFRPESDE
jgi:regulatory protein